MSLIARHLMRSSHAIRSPAVVGSSRMMMSSSSKSDRPISPHVQIYAFPVAALSSITTRITGVALSGGKSMLDVSSRCSCSHVIRGAVFVGSGVANAVTGDVDAALHMVQAFKESAPILVPLVKLPLSFAMVYHTLAGLRHLVSCF